MDLPDLVHLNRMPVPQMTAPSVNTTNHIARLQWMLNANRRSRSSLFLTLKISLGIVDRIGWVYKQIVRAWGA